MKVFLFTNAFPSGGGETFLSPECEIVAEIKDIELTIIPLFIENGMRELSPSITIDLSLSTYLERHHERKIWPLILSVPNIIAGLFTNPINSFRAIRDVVGFAHHGNLIAKWAQKNLAGDEFLYAYWFERITYGLALYKQRTKRDQCLVSRVHRYDLYEEKRPHGFIPYRAFTLRYLEKIFSISADGESYLNEKYPWFNSVELSRLGVPKRDLNEIKESEEIQTVSCSSVIKVKRVELIFEALQSVARSTDMKIHWIHFGDGPLLAELKGRVVEAPSNLKITLKGQVANPQVLEFYEENEVHLFLNLSDSEGVPVSIMEAISCGIPVIARDVGGNAEIVNDKTGVLLSPNPGLEEITNEIGSLLKAQPSREKIQHFHEEHYDSERNFQAFYQRLLTIQ